MTTVTLTQVNENILSLKKEVDQIKELLSEYSLELSEEAKTQIIESRKRPASEFKTQKEIEKRFL